MRTTPGSYLVGIPESVDFAATRYDQEHLVAFYTSNTPARYAATPTVAQELLLDACRYGIGSYS